MRTWPGLPRVDGCSVSAGFVYTEGLEEAGALGAPWGRTERQVWGHRSAPRGPERLWLGFTPRWSATAVRPRSLSWPPGSSQGPVRLGSEWTQKRDSGRQAQSLGPLLCKVCVSHPLPVTNYPQTKRLN